jgi:hypothetical protein
MFKSVDVCFILGIHCLTLVFASYELLLQENAGLLSLNQDRSPVTPIRRARVL